MIKALRCAGWTFFEIHNLHKEYLSQKRKTKKTIKYLDLNDYAKFELKHHHCVQEDQKWDLTVHELFPKISRKYVNHIKWRGHQYRCAESEDKREIYRSYQSYFRVECSYLDDTAAAAVEDGYRYGRILYFVKILIAGNPIYFARVDIYDRPQVCKYSNEPFIDNSKISKTHKYLNVRHIDAPITLAQRMRVQQNPEKNNKITAFPIENSYYALVAASTSPDF